MRLKASRSGSLAGMVPGSFAWLRVLMDRQSECKSCDPGHPLEPPGTPKIKSDSKPCPSFPWFFRIPWLILSKESPWLFVRFLWFSKLSVGSAGDKNPWLI